MSRPKNVEDFIRVMLPIAQKVREVYGVPVSVCLVQAGWESGWNLSNKSPFGTAKGGDPSKGFVQYASLEQAALAYGKNLRFHPAYRNAWVHQNNPEKFLDAIGDTYAPKQAYAAKLKPLLTQFDLTQYDEEMLFSPAGVPPAGASK